MSEMEMFTGKLIPTGKTVDEVMEDVEYPSYYDRDNPEHVMELFRDNFYHKKIAIDGLVYDVDKESFEDNEDIFKAKKLDNGEIEFTVKYYNGGCSFDEAIEIAIKDSV